MRGLQNIGPTTTKYYWGNDAIKKKPQSPFFVKVYQRKAEPE